MDTYTRIRAARNHPMLTPHTAPNHAPHLPLWVIAFWMAVGGLTVGIVQMIVR